MRGNSDVAGLAALRRQPTEKSPDLQRFVCNDRSPVRYHRTSGNGYLKLFCFHWCILSGSGFLLGVLTPPGPG